LTGSRQCFDAVG